MNEIWSRMLDKSETIKCLHWIKDRVQDSTFNSYMVDQEHYYMTGSINSQDRIIEQISTIERYGFSRTTKAYVVFTHTNEQLLVFYKLTWG